VFSGLTLGGAITDTIGPSGLANDYQFTLVDSERVTATVHPTAATGHTRLSLLRQDGGLLIQSAGQPNSPDDLIGQHLEARTYTREVQGPAGTSYTLTTQSQAAVPPFQPIPVSTGQPTFSQFAPQTQAMVSADFRRDGIQDIATTDGSSVSVFLGV